MSSLPAPQWHNSGSQTECVVPLFSTQDALCNGDHAPGAMVEGESVVVVVVVGGDQVGDHVELGGGGGDDDNDCGMSEISGGDLSLPEVCVSTDNASAGFEDDLSYEVQQAYRIFSGFLLDKYKGVTGSFFLPVDHVETQHGVGGVGSPGGAQRRQSVCLRSMEEKFAGRRYDTITAFVADFRLMLENCYRDHGVDHWLSKQAQKLEVMLEQKLTLLSRTLRAKTTLAVTSQGRFGGEEEQRNSGGTSTRRRSAPRSLTTITVGGHESVMVQALRQEELQRAKDGKRQRELDKKEAEETSAKEVEEWERSLLSQASPHSVDTLWELPAIGHFLCLAQTALHLPEIVFFELERSLLMPRCSLFLAKVMSSLLCPPQQRAAVHRQPPLPYRRWERELRQRVLAWYRVTGAATTDQAGRAERLGLCHRFFCVLGELSPLEAAPFHMLPFYQRVWLLKGLCDNVYETQKEVQDTVLAQPIHECRESILGYDGVDNAYIHFPHFCGADLRIYFQGPCTPPTFPFPALWARTIDAKPEAGFDGEDGKAWKGTECHGVSMESEEEEEEKCAHFKRENGGMAEKNIMVTLSSLKEVESDSGSVDEVRTSAKSTVKENAESSRLKHSGSKRNPARRSKRVPRGAASSASDSGRAIEAETHEPRLSVGEHCYTGRSPVWSSSRASPPQPVEVKTEGEPSPEWSRSGDVNRSSASASSSSESLRHSSGEKTNGPAVGTRKKKRKTRRERKCLERPRPHRTRSATTTTTTTAERGEAAVQRKDKRRKVQAGKKLENSLNAIKGEPPVEPPFKLVCSSIGDLRELISKTEDQLDTLQSTKKRSGGWYSKKEAVKDLHVTLVRLLKELLPWEPKLVKAFQRNRLRMKKECDDFRKHPDYANFVREECVSAPSSPSSSSSSSLDHEDGTFGRDACFLPLDGYRGTEEEDVEHAVPKGLWTRGNTMQLVTNSAGRDTVTYSTPSHPRPSSKNTDEDLNLRRGPPLKTDSSLTSPVNTASESTCEPGAPAQSGDSSPAPLAPALASLRARVPILHPTIGLPRGYTPIPTLFAKSVGNKVTLMKRPVDYPWSGSPKGCVGSEPPSPGTPAKTPAPHKPPSHHPHRTTCPEASERRQANKQPVVSTSTVSLAKPPNTTSTETAAPKSPVKVVYRVTEGPAHVLRRDGAGHAKITVQPLVDQKSGEKMTKQVVILPSKLLLQNNEDACGFTRHPQPSRTVSQYPVSTTAGPSCVSTNVPGFSIPKGRVQPTAPVNEAGRLKIPSLSGSPCLQQNTVTTTSRKVAPVCSPQSSTPIHSPMPTSSSFLASAAKQELKTVCIRDSQSILVTTRGGNTGIVKVQTLAEQTAHGSSPASPVITISPQFKAFLVSKGSPPVSSLSSSPTVSSTVPAAVGSSPAPCPSVSKCPLTGPTPLLTTASSNPSPAGLAVAVSHSVSPASVLPMKGNKLAIQTINAQASLVKSNMVVPSLPTGTPNAPTQETLVCKSSMKRPSAEEITQFTKFILVSPSSTCLSSSAALPKVTSPTPGSRFMFIGEPAAVASCGYMSAVPQQVPATGIGRPPVATSLSGEVLKGSLALGQHVGNVKSESSSNFKHFTLPSGVQLNQMKDFGQTVNSVLQSPSKSTPAITSPGLVLLKASSLVPSSPISPSVSLTTSSSPQKPPSIAVPHREASRSTSTVVTSTTGCTVAKDPPTNVCVPSFNNKSSPGTQNVQHQSIGNTTVCSTAHRPQPLVGASPLPPVVPATRPAASVPHTSASTTQILCSSSNTNALSSNGPVQQRIVINTSTHLAAGTQILLNNARFVVPPQGLAPGSHVLIISGRAPGTGTFTAPAAAPHAGPRNVSAAPRAGALPISPRPTIPCAPPLRSPVAAPTPPVGWPVLTSPVPCATQVCLTGAPMLSSSSMSDATKSVVPTLPRLQGSPRLCSTIAGTPALVTSPVGLDPKPALVFTTKSSVPVPGGTAPTAARSSAGTTKPTPVAASTFPPSTATHLPTTTTLPLSSLLTASSSTVSIHCSGTVPIASVMSVVAQSPEGIPLLSSATPSTKDGQSRMPVVAVSPNVHTVSRTPSLPVATVQPGRGLDSGLRVSPGANAFPPTSSASAVTPANPVGSLKLNEAIHAPVVAMATPALEKPFLQTQTEGHTSVESKLDLTALTATYTNSLQPTTTDLSKP